MGLTSKLCFVVLIFLGCTSENRESFPGGYEVEVIDGCEYLIRGGFPGYRGFMAHKGNCKNSIHDCGRIERRSAASEGVENLASSDNNCSCREVDGSVYVYGRHYKAMLYEIY